jgi:enediyne biosynthesis protein E4
MGVDAGDFDHDGDEDLFITELAREGHDLYVNDGSGVFEEQAARAGIRLASLPYTGFGAAWFDFDNDGRLDLLAVNGAVRHTAGALARRETFSLQQPKQLFRNLGNGQFADVTEQAGAVLKNPEVSRGAAFDDIDNDGDTDVVVANDGGPIRLLINHIGSTRHWVGVRVVGRQRRDMVGARGSCSRDRSHTVASGQSRWQLRVRQRFASAYRSRRYRKDCQSPRPVAGRERRRVD